MLKRALIAFLVLPGLVAFAIPVAWLRLTAHSHLAHPVGLILLTIGVIALLLCVREFYVSGKGTLAPWAPPEMLVDVGLYRYSRNPMYVSVTLVLLGWATSFSSRGLLAFALIMAFAFHLRVILGEEPWLRRKHGNRWEQYARRVPRWLW